jgi:peptide/nickel transport system substrate-binding protein
MMLLIDRKSVENHIYGRGVRDRELPQQPGALPLARTLKYEFNIDKANEILDEAGWKKGPDGIREKGGVKLKFVFQTSINAPRQKTQAIVKQAAARRPASTWS